MVYEKRMILLESALDLLVCLLPCFLKAVVIGVWWKELGSVTEDHHAFELARELNHSWNLFPSTATVPPPSCHVIALSNSGGV